MAFEALCSDTVCFYKNDVYKNSLKPSKTPVQRPTPIPHVKTRGDKTRFAYFIFNVTPVMAPIIIVADNLLFVVIWWSHPYSKIGPNTKPYLKTNKLSDTRASCFKLREAFFSYHVNTKDKIQSLRYLQGCRTYNMMYYWPLQSMPGRNWYKSVNSHVHPCMHERLFLYIWNCTCDPRFVYPKCIVSCCFEACKMSHLG